MGSSSRLSCCLSVPVVALALAACTSTSDPSSEPDPISPVTASTGTLVDDAELAATQDLCGPGEAGSMDLEGNSYCLGEILASGDLFESVEAGLSGTEVTIWIVSPVFTVDGIDQFNRAAVMCLELVPACPTGRLAMVLRGAVLTAPQVQFAPFERDQVQVTGDFTPEQAELIAALLNGPLDEQSFQLRGVL